MLSSEELLAKNGESKSYIDRDLLRTAIILHSIGRTKIYSINNDILIFNKKYTYINHEILGNQIILENIKLIKDYPEDRKNKLIYMIISLHSKNKWGTIAEPKFPEAELLYLLDLIDSLYNEFINKNE